MPCKRNLMPDEISPELFAHLVDLAALELTPDESDYLRRQMNNQLKAIRELASIPLDSEIVVAPHGITYSSEISPRNRKDEWGAYPDPERLLKQAPEVENEYMIVPEIPHKDLE
jgi:aspartyl/glutamyl-tRNA(Asn/Gln) amidotransferase C subunit